MLHKIKDIKICVSFCAQYTIQYNTIQYNTIQYNTIQYNTIQYNTIQYHAMPCHAMPCHAMPCHAMPCHAMPCHAMPCHAMPCHAMPCHAIIIGLNHAIFTISSLGCKLSPAHTLKWSGRNCVQITCNIPNAYHVQHVQHTIGRRGNGRRV